MKKALFTLSAYLVFIGTTLAQLSPKGASITSRTDSSKIGNTWAVIVGISKYQNVPGLNYADKDALAFYDYLVNKKGVDSAHVQLLINKKIHSLRYLRRARLA